MRKCWIVWGIRCALAGLLVLMSAGCTGGVASQEERDERDPLYRRAQSRKGMQDFDGALALYQKALDRKPGLGKAHLEMAMIYDTQKSDYLRAIYHYQRYIEIRPKAEKRDIVEDLIRHARINFAASLPNQPAGAIQEIAMLKKELEALKRQLGTPAAKRGEPSEAAAPDKPAKPKPPAAPPAPAVPSPQPAQTALETYTAQPGDTLSKIAGRVYRDTTKWKPIYEANRNVLASPQSVQAGQTLMIPRLPQ